MDLNKIRKDLDEMDAEIIRLMSKRILYTKNVAEAKFEMNKPLVDKEREKAIIEDRTEKFFLNGINDPIFAEKIFRTIIDKSLEIEEDRVKELKNK